MDEFAKWTEKFAAEATPAIQNKVGQFTSNPLIRNIVGQPNSTFDIRKMMDEKKILIINLSKGRVGEGNANLLGSMLITKIYLAAMSRADAGEATLKALPNFYLYVDEFQSFANESFADILSEARKYKLNLTIAHQYIEQMEEEVRAAVFGNVGTMITFRVGAYDAEVLEKEYAPQFTMEDIVNLGQYQMYLRLMIEGVGSAPFSAKGMSPIPRPEKTFTKETIDMSRAQFSRPRAEVEQGVSDFHEAQRTPAKAAPVASAPKASPISISAATPVIAAKPTPTPKPEPVKSGAYPFTPKVEAKPAMTNPFKEAFAKVDIEKKEPIATKPSEISLTDLAKPHPIAANAAKKKSPTPASINSLRDALKAVLPPEKAQSAPETTTEKPTTAPKEAPAEAPKSSLKEIPEPMLRGMLDVQ